ncbi:hypothetical protein E4T56_gene3206 [Termitomyces sp. T112]|nr:hypothetical protein E4T56_gene3206 [Termitomyces sp. T112]
MLYTLSDYATYKNCYDAAKQYLASAPVPVPSVPTIDSLVYGVPKPSVPTTKQCGCLPSSALSAMLEHWRKRRGKRKVEPPWAGQREGASDKTALGESLLGGRDPLALVTEHSKMFRALMACADSWWDVIRTDLGRSGEVRLQGNETVLAGFMQKTIWEIRRSEGVGGCVINGNGARRVIAAWETKLKRSRRFVRVLLNQLKALDVPRGFPNFVMSSPSVPVVSPADLDEVVVYDSGGEEFERRRRGRVRDLSQSSVVVVVDFPGVPKWTKFRPALPKGKGASLAVVRGKCRASPPSGVGPSKRPHGRELLAGPPESSLFSPVPGVPLEWSSSPPALIPLITEVFLRKQVEALTTLLAVREGELRRAREDHDAAWTEKEAMEQERNTSVRVATERALEVRGLREHLAQMEGQPAGEAEGRGRVPEGDALWVELEVARRREDWLANEATSGRAGILHELSPVPPFVTDGSFSGFRLGVGASGPLGWCLRGVHVDSGRVDAGVRSPASGVAAGDGAIGEVVGGASATQCGGPGVVVGGGS